MSRLDPTAFIRMNLPVWPVPGIPEIELHKASPTSGLWRLARQDKDGFGAPYWAHYWAGGLALARYVLDNPFVVAGQRVLDLGAGSGLVGIAAAKAAALKLNANLNAASISVLHGDITNDAPPEVDVVLVGDLFYEADLSKRVEAFLNRCSSCGMRVLIGDPWRAHLPASRLAELARYVVTEGGSHGVGPSGVFAFVPRPNRGGQSA
jgi:predicted nicotinamide N-methyase